MLSESRPSRFGVRSSCTGLRPLPSGIGALPGSRLQSSGVCGPGEGSEALLRRRPARRAVRTELYLRQADIMNGPDNCIYGGDLMNAVACRVVLVAYLAALVAWLTTKLEGLPVMHGVRRAAELYLVVWRHIDPGEKSDFILNPWYC